ncbi:MAG: hypothetical protein HZB26_24495 [Candidatus Hydrogenedentes bacterium]|nr:hypothetical protein [Candidatus Hydrogenedentota bacterium]
MNEEPGSDSVPPATLREHFAAAWRRANRRRPISFYLLLAMIAALLMGAPMIWAKNDPKKFALCLSLSFLFFFVIIYRAIIDFLELVRRFFAEREQVYKNTLGAQDFAERLGQRVNDHDTR